MSSLNKVMIIGNLGADPEIRYTAGGSAVTNIRVATSEKWRDKQSDEIEERTEWHRVVLFGKKAEVVAEYVKKGQKLYIEGRLQTSKWQAADGSDRYSTEVVADDFKFLSPKGGSGESQQGGFRDSDIPF